MTALREPLGANMEYKNYEEWKAEGEKVQAELIRVDEQRRQARIDGDDNGTFQPLLAGWLARSA